MNNILRKTWLFSELDTNKLNDIVEYVEAVTYSDQSVLFEANRPAESLIVIQSGQVNMLRSSSEDLEAVTVVSTGAILGERLLLGEPIYLFTAKAIGEVETLQISKAALDQIAQKNPLLYKALGQIATRHLSYFLQGKLSLIERSVAESYRQEHDLIGYKDVPQNALYGVQTLRALENFPISGIPISTYTHFIEALACIKQAASRANKELNLLDEKRQWAIDTASQEIRMGHHHQDFVVDVIQGGAGTSANMNANEVITNRALELLGKSRGDYAYLHPLNHVNMSQSTNDVYPTAIKIALHFSIQHLLTGMEELAESYAAKAEEFKEVLKVGRTQLQDAVPMTLGQEFSTYAEMLNEDRDRLKEALQLIREINMGATAIGTGINAHPDYAGLVCQHLSKITGIDLITAPNLVEATQDAGVFVHLSGILKRIAVKLSKTCNDLRLLSSGPRAGLGEINLPPMQPGSSIMPGKVNPVIPEVVNQIAFEVIGNDMTVTMAAEAGQLQLNAFEPIIAHSLFQSINHLRNGCVTLARRCIRGITANHDRLREQVEHSISLVTALNPYIGYENSTRIAAEALTTGQSVYQLVLDNNLLSKEELDEILKPENMIKPRLITH